MIEFWIAAAVLSALAAALVLYRAARLAGRPAANPTVDVYRRQLSEIDELAERGLLANSERRSARAEAARRLLSAADEAAAGAASAPKAAGKIRLIVTVAAIAAPLVAVVAYLVLGSPGAADQPFAERLKVWRGVSDPSQLTAAQMAAVLTDVLKTRPADVQGHMLLARAQAAAGDMPSAVQTLRTTSRLAPNDADVWAALGEAMVEQGQGQESPGAVAVFSKAVALNPMAVSARYHLGRAKVMNGDLNGGLADWQALAAVLPPGEAQDALNEQIAASRKAGRLVDGPSNQDQQQAQAAGPTDSQVQAAQQAQAGAPPADRRAFIQSMVDGMAASLKANPGNLQGWTLLIRSYGVLGETDKQADALAKARAQFKTDPPAQKALSDALTQGAQGDDAAP